MKQITLSLFLSVFYLVSASGQITVLPIEFDTIGYLTEINADNQADAYPWLSDDGLRIYFVQRPDSLPVSLIYHAERPSVQDAFSNIQLLPVNFPDESNFSPWLTDDELTIYFSTTLENGTMSTSLYRATRATMNDEFSNPTLVQLQGQINGFTVSPSLSPDGEQLYMWNSDLSNEILVFENSGTDAFTFSNILEAPVDYTHGTCKMSPDGLRLYLSLRFQSDFPQIYFYQRDALDEEFTELFYLENDQLNPTIVSNLQPAIGCGGECLAFTRAATFVFFANDLMLASRIPSASENIFKPAVGVNLFPNPAVDFVNFEFEVPEKYTDLRLLTFNANGQMVEEISLSSGTNKFGLDLTDYSEGSYFYQLRSNTLLLVAGKFLKK